MAKAKRAMNEGVKNERVAIRITRWLCSWCGHDNIVESAEVKSGHDFSCFSCGVTYSTDADA